MLRYAARGNFGTAGRLLKEFCASDEKNFAMAQCLIAELDKSLAPRKGGGKTTAKIRHTEKSERDRKILSGASKLLEAGRKPHEIAAILSRTLGYTADHIRKVIKKSKAD